MGREGNVSEDNEVRLLDEAVRLNYLSLEGAGPDAVAEALFFLEWHYDIRESRKIRKNGGRR